MNRMIYLNLLVSVLNFKFAKIEHVHLSYHKGIRKLDLNDSTLSKSNLFAIFDCCNNIYNP